MLRSYSEGDFWRSWSYADHDILDWLSGEVYIRWTWKSQSKPGGCYDQEHTWSSLFGAMADLSLPPGEYRVLAPSGSGDQYRPAAILASDFGGLGQAIEDLMSGPPTIMWPGRMGTPNDGPSRHHIWVTNEVDARRKAAAVVETY